MKRNITLAIAALGLAITSCKKDRPTDCPATTAGLSGTYKLQSMSYKLSAAAPAVDYMQFMESCEKDDRVTLKANGTYEYVDAGEVCTQDGSNDGTWSVNGTSIESDGLISGTIESFDCNTLVYYVDGINTTGDRLTFTMKKQ